MVIPGTVIGGVVVLEGGQKLPEGTAVSVIEHRRPAIHVAKERRPVSLPLVRSSRPGSIELTGDQIAELLNDQDLSS